MTTFSEQDLHCAPKKTQGEVDLSHNVVNESSALELLKLFVDPKYSKRVKVEPVKVDLSHNGFFGLESFKVQEVLFCETKLMFFCVSLLNKGL